MDTYLARNDAPLNADEWNAIDNVVVDVAKRILVGRRFLSIFGPLGAGIQDLDYNTFRGMDGAAIGMLGEEETTPIRAEDRLHITIPLVYKDFVLYWRDIETSRRMGFPLDLGAAAAAASYCAYAEDDLIFNGGAELGFAGLMTVQGRTTIDARDWAEAGSAFEDVVAATQKLIENGFFGPFAVAVSPLRYSQMHRVYADSGVLEIEHVRAIATAGVFQTPVLKDYGMVFSVGPQNADIAISQDLVTAYLGPQNLNHPLRVLESLVLRVKRPGAICTFESGKKQKN
ncbi:MAG: family 1 encapsulin nanocompartment shell protein [Armatimonadota bacterium]|nr:family 1 encapsulin nanocompartment shell protein [Armatimonadota bacterium]